MTIQQIFILPLCMLFPILLKAQVLDDICERKILKEKRIMPHAPIREADVFWEKRVWRVIDVREKMNQAFMYPEAPFFDIMVNAAEKGKITLYSVEDDKFTYSLSQEDANAIISRSDTFRVFNPVTYTDSIVVANERIFYEDVKRFRIKEIWYFDENTSTMKVRILGIAPLYDKKDEHGNVLFERPLFWVYFPELREVLAREQVFLTGNDAHAISWADVFEQRYFSSTIMKASNIRNNRLEDMYTGINRLLEAEKIEQKIFNFEHDLWSY